VGKVGFMKKLQFIIVCTLILLISVIVFGCKKESDLEANSQQGVPPEELVLDKRSFTGDMQKPVKIKIEKIGVECDIVGVEVDEEGRMPVPSQAIGVTWYELYASPGWYCNAILTAHNYFNGVEGTFVRLKDLVLGDTVEFTYEDGSIGHFQVFYSESFNEDSVPEDVMLPYGATRTTLITCDGERKPQGGYPRRIIVALEAIDHLDVNGQPLPMEEPEATDKE